VYLKNKMNAQEDEEIMKEEYEEQTARIWQNICVLILLAVE